MWRLQDDRTFNENARGQVCRRIRLQTAGRVLWPIYQWLSTLGVERQTQNPAEGTAWDVAQRIAVQVVFGVAVRVAVQATFPVAILVAALIARSIALSIALRAVRIVAV